MTLPGKPIITKTNPSIYLQAANALVGPSLEHKKNLLIGISGGIIDSIKPLPLHITSENQFDGRPLIKLDESLFLLPALIDAHVHLALDGSGLARAPLQLENEAHFTERLEQVLQEYARAGIGLLRDGGDCCSLNIKARKLLQQTRLLAPNILACGQALRRADAYGAFLGPGFTTGAELVEQFKELQSQHVDYIKVIVSGIVSFNEYGLVSGPLIKAGDLQHVVHLAREAGLRVMAHASSDQAVQLAIEAGVNSIEHGYYSSEESLKAMAEKEIAWVPTVIPVAAQIQEAGQVGKQAEEVEIIRRIVTFHLEKIGIASQLGVPLGMGTDSGAAGVRHGKALHDEVALYLQAGLSAKEVITSATVTNARVAGCGDRIGKIEVGCQASLIAINGNPLKEPSCLNNVKYHFIPTVMQD